MTVFLPYVGLARKEVRVAVATLTAYVVCGNFMHVLDIFLSVFDKGL